VDIEVIPSKADQIEVVLKGEVSKRLSEDYTLETSVDKGNKLLIEVKEKDRFF
jgi:hypothetical protein